MHLKIKPDYTRADAVRFESEARRIVVSFRGIEQRLPLDAIPASDWDSQSPVTGFALSHEGAVVICQHADGEETLLPVDMWEPGGFTPLRLKSKRLRKSPLPKDAQALVEIRERAGLSRHAAATLTNVPYRTLEQWEQGRQKPTRERLEKFLSTVEISIPRHPRLSSKKLMH